MVIAAISSGGWWVDAEPGASSKTLDVRIQGKGNFVETPSADSVGAAFAFLDLFETDADFVAQHGLTQPKHPPARAYHLTDMRINWILLLFVISCHERRPQVR